jgi:hypothetical protein
MNTSLQNVLEIMMTTSKLAHRPSMLKEGTLRKIAPKVYTTNMDEAPEVIIMLKKHTFADSQNSYNTYLHR